MAPSSRSDPSCTCSPILNVSRHSHKCCPNLSNLCCPRLLLSLPTHRLQGLRAKILLVGIVFSPGGAALIPTCRLKSDMGRHPAFWATSTRYPLARWYLHPARLAVDIPWRRRESQWCRDEHPCHKGREGPPSPHQLLGNASRQHCLPHRRYLLFDCSHSLCPRMGRE